jgi:glycerol-3-phosphate cytidylyltransferase
MKNIITYGTFDTFHYGHLELLQRAKELGDYLIVAVSTDKFNAVKGKTSMFSYEKRKQWVESIRFVDQVIPEHSWEQKTADILDYNIDILVMGDDWKEKFNFLPCQTIYLPRTKTISSTGIKTIL